MNDQMKKCLCLVLALLLVTLSACKSSTQEQPAEPKTPEAAPVQPASATEPEPEPEPEPATEPEIETAYVTDDDMLDPLDIPFDEGSVFVNSGMRLTVPNEYAPLVLISQGSPLFGRDNLFSAREIASMEAGQKVHPGEDWGDGALFGIGRLTEDEAHEILCDEILNVRQIGRDAEDYYYFCFYPTDVRLMREDMENLIGTPDLQQWADLNDWAAAVPEQFLKDNPGVQPWPYRDTEVTTYLARIAYRDGQTEYSLIYDYLELTPRGTEGASFAADLAENVGYEYCIDEEAPDGEYQVVYLPLENVRLYFYKGADYVTVDHDGYSSLYRIIAPSRGYCLDVLERWADALEG